MLKRQAWGDCVTTAYFAYRFIRSYRPRGEADYGAVLDNLKVAFGGEPASVLDAIARDHLRFRYRIHLHKELESRLSKDGSWWEIRGLEHLDEALDRGCGAILVSAHYGHVKAIPPALRTLGYPARLVRDQAFSAGEGRPKQSAFHGRLGDLYAGLDVRPLLSALSENHALMILGDGMRASEFILVNLLGQKYPLPVGVMKLALSMNASILPVFTVEAGYRLPLRIVIRAPLHSESEHEGKAYVHGFATLLDRQVRETPYLWHRWTIPRLFDISRRWAESDDRWTCSFKEWAGQADGLDS